ncbi:hypothetical protein [Plebeiibacterium sediminum]|uniref:Uncharacterized protein n=1 Tax=Plebeiibacterium sediminum TaxID=2992112 RepID=A0AAE3M8Z3_9BACT|nr:hypothetical protein [Plebeiobacterium sediminum]MCW3789431.1 hypothetical protein [Plebeiobacterium sediminum]
MKLSLKQTRQQLQSISKKFNWEIDYNNGRGEYNASGLILAREVINEIESLNLFENLINQLKSSVIFTSANDNMNIKTQEGAEIVRSLELLKELIENFLSVLLKTIPEENVDSVNIKLPEISDFDELSKVSRDIHLALTQVILNDEINGETRIVSVENGSIWLNVFVGATAVSVVASLAWSAAVVYKKIQEGKLLEQQVRGLKVKNDSLEDILKAQKAETELLIQAEADFINSEHFKTNEPENIERIKSSLSTLSKLIEKGAEIQPALVAPENVANLFPNPKKILNIESRIKKLADPNDN